MEKTIPISDDFFPSKKVLLVTDNSTDKTTWRKLFTDLGVATANLFTANTLNEALATLKNHHIDFVFSSFSLEKRSTTPLIQRHLKLIPDRSKAYFFLIAEKNTLTVEAIASEYDIDGFLVKPYNIGQLTEYVISTVEDKINWGKERLLYYKVMQDIENKKVREAKSNILKYKVQEPEDANVYYLDGLLQDKLLNQTTDAITSWKQALERDAIHYGALIHLFDKMITQHKFHEAYEYALPLLANYPINPDRIPNILRVALVTRNYKDICDLSEMILEDESNLTDIQKPIAAGLALSGKYIAKIEKNKDIAFKALKKAIELSVRNSPIQYSAIEGLIQIGKFDYVKEIIDQIPTDEMSEKMHAYDLLLTSKSQDAITTYTKAQDIIKRQIRSPEIYEILIKSCHEVGKNQEYISEIAIEASEIFPEKKDMFQGMVDESLDLSA